MHEPHAAHFVTSTIVAWLPGFTTAARCLPVQSWLHGREHKGLRLHGWVIPDNHFHAVLSAPDLMQVMRDFKRHIARRIPDPLPAEGCDWLLHQSGHCHAVHKVQSERQVWQEGFHPVAITDDEMLLHKLEYLHSNPVKRGLVAAPAHWRYPPRSQAPA